MSYDNTNTGLLARNKRKTQDNHPTHTGSINVEGKEYWLSAWVKEGKEGSKMAGEKFFSLSLKPQDESQTSSRPATRAPVQPAGTFADESEEIPF